MQRYPVGLPSREQATSLLLSSITWAAVCELGQTCFNGRGSEWWAKYVQDPLAAWGGYAPYQAVGTYATGALVDTTAFYAANAASYAVTPLARAGARRRWAAFSAPLVWKLSRIALNLSLKIAGRTGVTTSLKAAGISAALPSGGWSVAAALAGVALDAWSVYEIFTLRKTVVASIVDTLYP